MSELLGLAPYAALGIFLIFVVYPVIIAGSTIRFSAWATLAWTLATLAWLVPVAWAQFALAPGARTITLQLGFLAGFCLFGLILIMVVAWRLNAVGKTRWLAVLTPLLPLSLLLIGYICLLPGDTRQLSGAQRRQEKAQARAAAKAAKQARKQARKQAPQAAPDASEPARQPLATPRLAGHIPPAMPPAMPPLPDSHYDTVSHYDGGPASRQDLPPLRPEQPARHPAPRRGYHQPPQAPRRQPTMPPLPMAEPSGVPSHVPSQVPGPAPEQTPAPTPHRPPRLPQAPGQGQVPGQGHPQQQRRQSAAPGSAPGGMPPPLPPKRRS